MFVLAMMSVAQSSLTFHRLIADIPHDAAAIVVYALIVVSIVLIWRANRPRRRS